MKNSRYLIFSMLTLGIIVFISLGNSSSKDNHYAYSVSDPNYCVCTTFDTVYFQPKVPHDSGTIPNQAFANCFAWKEFIALNWPMDGSNDFGNPTSESLVQWETYMTRDVLMPKDGSAPPPWGSKSALLSKNNRHKRILIHSTKFTDFNDTIAVTETGQAFPEKTPSWLGAHNNTNLWYEILVNKDEYDYITDPEHQFYNADKQLSWTNDGNMIHLPKGSNSNDTIGAIEIKAAWMEISNPPTIDVSRYKISEAILIDPITGKQRATEVALIGLHIIHKTVSQPTWIWATFEHVDNAPIKGKTPSGNYNLYSTSCTNKTMNIPAEFSETGKDTIITIDCNDANVSPPYYLGAGGPKPTQLQVIRETSFDQNAIKINTIIQKAIKDNYTNSVFQYYELIDVIWSSNPVQDSQQPMVTPLKLNSMNPNNNVANATMETYIQNGKCTDCHQFSSIAGKSNNTADFSFVLSAASPAKD